MSPQPPPGDGELGLYDPAAHRQGVVADIAGGFYPGVELTVDPPDGNADHGHNERHEMDEA